MTAHSHQPAASDAARRVVVVFAGQRSGSNYLCDLLGQVPGTLVLSEIFNARDLFGLNLHPEIETALIKEAGSRARLSRLFRMNPVAAMQMLLGVVPPELVIVLKVQPNQVHRQALRQILGTHGAGAIFLVRRRLDQYISLCKARAIGAWYGADTTDVRPNVGAARFLAWSGVIDDWLGDMARLCRQIGLGAIQFDYEQDLQAAERPDLAQSLGPRLAQVGLRVKTGDLMGESYFHRQDSGEDPFDKLENAAELRVALEALGLTEYALSRIVLGDGTNPIAPEPA